MQIRGWGSQNERRLGNERKLSLEKKVKRPRSSGPQKPLQELFLERLSHFCITKVRSGQCAGKKESIVQVRTF